jgi:LuxR family maltose regulon positive regulatory protein
MPQRRVSEQSVDSPPDRSISFGQPPDTRRPLSRYRLIDVGPDSRATIPDAEVARLVLDSGTGLQVHATKVQRPALREETLERTRLLEWLGAHVHGRVVLVTADPGYGKTTLLADFSRRSRLRTLWYRLDPTDTTWSVLLSHLVAAGREYDQSFAPATSALLQGPNAATTTREQAIDSFLAELREIAAPGLAIIFDDYHVVEDSPDCHEIANALVLRGPERLTTFFLSRRSPRLQLGRLRASGEVAELTTEDLRFDLTETTRLFNDTYGRGLETDVVHALASRTEGWIASLQLVQTALRDRSPQEIRRFVANLSGADHELYDYLAEVVVGELPEGVQQFLMATAILQVVTPELAAAAADVTPDEVNRLTNLAERLTLLGKISGSPRTHRRYHPLVREFLEARLINTEGAAAVAALHRRVAALAGHDDWRIAAHHYREAGDLDSMLATVSMAVPTIMANGQYAQAEGFLGDVPSERRPAGANLVLGRVDLQHGDYEGAARSARAVLDASPGDAVQRDHALLNLLAVSFNYGRGEEAIEIATTLLDQTKDPNLRSIAEATLAILQVSTEHDLDGVNRKLRSMAREQRLSQSHHFAVSMYNLAANSLIQDRLKDAETEVEEALGALAGTSSVVERQAAAVLHIEILLRTGRETEAETRIRELLAATPAMQNDALLGAADAFDAFGSRDLAEELLDRVGDQSAQTLVDRRVAALTTARILLRRGNIAEADSALERYPDGISTVVGMAAAKALLVGQVALAKGLPDGRRLLTEAAARAAAEGVHGTRRTAELLVATCSGETALRKAVVVTIETSPWHLTEVSETLVPLLPTLDDKCRKIIQEAAQLHPNRWRAELRSCLDDPRRASPEAAAILEEIGERTDVLRLRRFAKGHRRNRRTSNFGRGLARRLADRVFVEDQGRVVIRVGPREVAGSTIRRKVLGLLCFLLARQESAATRDQVLDAMWPDLDPVVATNSLNQTLYFLRRVFEEDYAEDLSPGYVHHENDVIWLDPDLVTSRTNECRRLIRAMPVQPSPDDVAQLATTYRGRFALDFEYEEWAAAYREMVHAAYLEVIERSLLEDMTTGHHERAIAVARRALEADPGSDQIEVSLLRLYKSIGAHSAAAEQYAHYSSVMRDELGIDPPPLESL